MRSRLTVLTTVAALGAGGVLAFLTSPAPALADYTPPALVDAQTFPIRATVFRLGSGRFGCHSLCRSAETDGGQPRFCALAPAMDAGTYGAAGVECVTESISGCTPRAVHECANPVQAP